jgi:hypothetical protein
MAIHPFLPGVSVEIHCDNEPLPEYSDPDPDFYGLRESQHYRAVSTYVECTPGSSFTVQFKVEKLYEHDCDVLCFCYSLDVGLTYDNFVCIEKGLEKQESWITIAKGSPLSVNHSVKPFIFVPLTIQEGGSRNTSLVLTGQISYSIERRRNN